MWDSKVIKGEGCELRWPGLWHLTRLISSPCLYQLGFSAIKEKKKAEPEWFKAIGILLSLQFWGSWGLFWSGSSAGLPPMAEVGCGLVHGWMILDVLMHLFGGQQLGWSWDPKGWLVSAPCGLSSLNSVVKPLPGRFLGFQWAARGARPLLEHLSSLLGHTC